MMYMLGLLAEQGRLQNFTALAAAVGRIEESLQFVDDEKALTRVGKMLDHVFSQAYRGEKPMAFLAERVESVLEVLDLVRQPEPGLPTEPVDDPWEAEAPTHVRASAWVDEDDKPATVWKYGGSAGTDSPDGSPQ